MKLLPKFLLTGIGLFIFGYILAGAFAWHQLTAAANEEVYSHAHMLTAYAAAVRTYTDDQIVPISRSKQNGVFRSQWIPFYAATQVFAYARSNFPGYTYKEAALNPTNPRDRAEGWEADIINEFRDNPGMRSYDGSRQTLTGGSLVVAIPIVATTGCLSCHSQASVAPAGMVKLYGADNGFGWKDNEIVGAEIVSAPSSSAIASAWHAFVTLMLGLGGVTLAIVGILGLLLTVIVVRPIHIFAKQADAISQGRVDEPEIENTSKDEIGDLRRAFNRMTRSLRKALKLLESGS